jgi:hypothetical protein
MRDRDSSLPQVAAANPEEGSVLPIVLPLGHLRGPFFEGPEKPPEFYSIRIGWGVADLTETEFHLWALAHGLPNRLNEPWTIEPLLAAARDIGAENPEAVFNALAEKGVLVDVHPIPDEDGQAFAQAVRLMPLMTGLGNNPEQPGLYRVGLPQNQVVELNDTMFELWSRSHLEDNLWLACQSLARINAEAGSTDETETDPTAILYQCLTGLHGLLTTGVAYLDVAIERKV